MDECDHEWRYDEHNVYSIPNLSKVRYDCMLCGDIKYESMATAKMPLKNFTDTDYRFNALKNRVQVLENYVERYRHELIALEKKMVMIWRETTAERESREISNEVRGLPYE